MLPPLSGAGSRPNGGAATYLAMSDDKKPASLQEFDAKLRQARDAADAEGWTALCFCAEMGHGAVANEQAGTVYPFYRGFRRQGLLF